MYSELKEYILKRYKEGNNVRVNVTRIDYDPDVEYNTTCGVYVNNELDEVFELTKISNNGIDKLINEINQLISRNTLYLI